MYKIVELSKSMTRIRRKERLNIASLDAISDWRHTMANIINAIVY